MLTPTRPEKITTYYFVIVLEPAYSAQVTTLVDIYILHNELLETKGGLYRGDAQKGTNTHVVHGTNMSILLSWSVTT